MVSTGRAAGGAFRSARAGLTNPNAGGASLQALREPYDPSARCGHLVAVWKWQPEMARFLRVVYCPRVVTNLACMHPMKSGRRCPPGRVLVVVPFLILQVFVTVGCGDSYQLKKPIEGVYQPTRTAPNGSHCVQIEGRRDGWLGFPTVQMIICGPVRANELGVMTYGWEVRQPGLQLEVARLECSDGGVFFATNTLQGAGRLEYTDRSPTLGDWTRHNPLKTAVLVLAGLVVAVTIPLWVSARERKRIDERERLEAETAARAAAPKAAMARLRQLTAEARSAGVQNGSLY